MKKIITLIIIAAMTLSSCTKEEKEVCTTCTIYNDINNTIYDVYTVCLDESTMESYLDEVFNSGNATSHYVCTDPE
ncbi:MAG: hypothetical protein RBT49_01340 [Bacteroidales bacterium]|jgi:hypothetical protein|nr:hypothetical protein [Bacteroidales bacterium]